MNDNKCELEINTNTKIENNIENNLDTNIRYLKGVGEQKEKLLNKLNIYNVWDLISYFPRTYQDRSKIINICDCIDGEDQLIEGIIRKPVQSFSKGRKSFCKIYLEDQTGKAIITFFNQSYIKNIFKAGYKYKFYGKVSKKKSLIEMINPVFDENDINKNTGYIVPIYPLTHQLSQNNLRNAIKACLDKYINDIEEYLPQEILDKYMLMDIKNAYLNMHFPKDAKSFKLAKRRFVYEELFLTQVALLNLKKKNIDQNIDSIAFDKNILCNDFIKTLPFVLTDAQKRVINEIENDMNKNISMNRLIQGDVGSGKTVVAMSALYKAVKSGYQGVLMAPTAILALQHYENFKKMFSDFNINIELLVSDIPKKKKEKIISDIESGIIDIVIGTHALLEDNVVFKNLGLVITDEQHRFGVKQREKLNKKSKKADIIVMSATPIPRTLGLILYGDLDISIIDELPPNRKQIKTFAKKNSEENEVYEFVCKNLEKGRQAYIVCPLVDENEALDLESVNELYERLSSDIFRNYNVGIIHGKLKEKQKDKIMNDFKDKKIDVLIATTVIEVGVDVPNANVMVIKDSQRFGLAQLHQLRGRVGRGEYNSYCFLLYNGGSEITKKRIKTMVDTNDGFVISQKDLELRGMGDFFGTAQHGIIEFKVANLFQDLVVLKYAQMDAINIVNNNLLKNYPKLDEKIKKLYNYNLCI